MSWASAAAFYHQLGTMLRAGLTLSQAIDHAGAASGGFHARNAPLWSAGCASGGSLASQLAASGEDKVAQALVLAGEQSGKLPEMAKEIAAGNEHRMALRRMVIGKLVYPLFLINVALLVPGVVGWFKGGSGLAVILPPLLFWLVVGGAAIVLYVTRESGLGARIALLPGVRTITGPLVAANTCLVLHATTTAGMLHHRGLELAADGCGNREMAARLRHAATELLAGRLPTFSAACATCGLPRPVMQLIEAGEVSGALEANLGRAATLSRVSFEERTTWAARICTGLVFALAIALVGYTVISMYAGMYSEAMKMAEDI